jgi:hypothetical protein
MKKLQILIVVLLVLLIAWQANLVSAGDGCPPRCFPGTGTPGYWKNHPDAWPVGEITFGGVTYTKAEAIEIMDGPVKGDKSITLFKALVAAKLNVLALGGPDNLDCVGCIGGKILRANLWLEDNPLGSGVKASSAAWQGSECPVLWGEDLYLSLDAFNKGELCAPSRDAFEE